MKKILLMLLCIALVVSMATFMASCQKDEEEDKKDDESGNTNNNGGNNAPCTTHTDANGDFICDNCEEILLPSAANVEMNFTIKLAEIDEEITEETEGAILSGVTLIFIDKNDNIITTASSDANGKITQTLKEGDYYVMYEHDYESLGLYYVSVTSNLTVNKDKTEQTLWLFDNTPDGTARKPFPVNAEDTTLTLPANTAYNFIIYRSANLYFIIEGSDVKVTYGNETYTPNSENKIQFNLVGQDTNSAATLLIENTSDVEVTYDIVINYVPGDMGNPFILDAENLGQEITTKPVTMDTGVFYKHIAAVSGTFTITMSSENTIVSMTNNTTSENVRIDRDSETFTISLDVNAGDEIVIECASINQTEREVVFTPTLTKAE